MNLKTWLCVYLAVAVTIVFTRPISAKELKIVSYGTSLTDFGAWQDSLGRMLTECRGETVTVLNRGKSGKAGDWGALNAGTILADQPEIVLIEFSYNDAYADYHISPSDSDRFVSQIISEIRHREKSVRIFLMTMNPASIKNGEQLRPNLLSYYEVYRKVARREGVGLIDSTGRWPAMIAEIIPDGSHPTPIANVAFLVPSIVDELRPIVCR